MVIALFGEDRTAKSLSWSAMGFVDTTEKWDF